MGRAGAAAPLRAIQGRGPGESSYSREFPWPCPVTSFPPTAMGRSRAPAWPATGRLALPSQHDRSPAKDSRGGRVAVTILSSERREFHRWIDRLCFEARSGRDREQLYGEWVGAPWSEEVFEEAFESADPDTERALRMAIFAGMCYVAARIQALTEMDE